jgi:hypothetical protein
MPDTATLLMVSVGLRMDQNRVISSRIDYRLKLRDQAEKPGITQTAYGLDYNLWENWYRQREEAARE